MAAAVLLSSPGLCTAQAPMTLDDVLWPVSTEQAELSPDGAHVALIERLAGKYRVTLVDTDSLTSRILIETYTALDGSHHWLKRPRRVTWITPELLAVDYGRVAQAHNLQGKVVAQLGAAVLGKAAPGEPLSPWVLVYEDWERTQVALVNAKTQSSRTLRYPMSGKPLDWTFDELGNLRAVELADSAFWRDETTRRHWYLPPGGEQWEKLEEFKATDETFTPVSASGSSPQLIVRSRQGRDNFAVFNYDPIQRRMGTVLAEHPTEDVMARTEPGTGRLQRVVFGGMKPRQQWLDPDWVDVQVAVDQVLLGRFNSLSGNPFGRVLIHSYADVEPGRWYLLDVPKSRLRLLAIARPRMAAVAMRPMEITSYPSLDGLAIPAFLTLPAGDTRRRPMVVMVHGGPHIRDHWGWDEEVQLLAAQGYAVLQPQFRGSTGFGKAFETAGFGQWGRAMQDDITAGVRAMIERGIADPARICIYGASYGGYAAVWGLIKTPELFRCGITLAGVSDLENMLTDWSDTNRNKLARQVMRHIVGDASRDAGRLGEVSPLKHAQKIQVPVLIAHSDDDVRVPISHSKKLMSAMNRAGKPYEWVPLYDEGHGVQTLHGQYTFAKALLKFLETHLAMPGQTTPTSRTSP